MQQNLRDIFFGNLLVEPGRERRIRRRPRDWLAAPVRSVPQLPGMAREYCADKAFPKKKARIAPRPALSIGSGAEITASTETPGSNIASRSPL